MINWLLTRFRNSTFGKMLWWHKREVRYTSIVNGKDYYRYPEKGK